MKAKTTKKELSNYAKFHIYHRGKEARYRGKVVCKAQAYQIEKAGKGSWIDWYEKPGWKNGELVDQIMQHDYLNKVYFE